LRKVGRVIKDKEHLTRTHMAFLGKLFGGLFGGNTNTITTTNVTSIAMSVAANTAQNCTAITKNDIFNNSLFATNPDCTSNIHIGPIKVELDDKVNLDCLQSASSQMTSDNDISAQVSNALKSVQDGLSKTFNALSATEKNNINSTIKTFISNTFTQNTTQTCKKQVQSDILGNATFMGGCFNIDVDSIDVKAIAAATVSCVQNQAGVVSEATMIRDTMNNVLSQEVKSPFAWMGDIAKQFAIVAAIAVVVGGVAMIAKGEDPISIAEEIQNGGGGGDGGVYEDGGELFD
jgi:hypothetical protein